MKRTLPGILCGLSAAAIWGAMYVVSKVILDIIPPFTLLSLRLVLGAGTLAIILAIQGWAHVTPRQFAVTLGVGFIGYGISLGFQFVGTKLSSASNGAVVTSATPAFVLIIAWFILKEKITSRKLIALLISSLGVAAVIDPRTARFDPELYLGNLSLLAAALTWAAYSVLVRKFSADLRVIPFTAIAFLGGLPVSIPMSFWELSTYSIGTITWGVLAGVLFLGVVSTALAMVLWNTAFALVDASVASLTFFAQPLVGTILGIIFLGERISSLFILGGILIAIGIILASYEREQYQKIFQYK